MKRTPVLNPPLNLNLVMSDECVTMHEAIREVVGYAEHRRIKVKTADKTLKAAYLSEMYDIVNDWKHFIHCMDIVNISGNFHGP